MGRTHARALATSAEVEIVCVVEPSDEAAEHVGFFHRIGLWFSSVFGIGRPHGLPLTTSQQVARNVARAVAAGVATQVAAELAKSTGSKTAGTIGKAVVRGALGGVMRR